MITNQEIAVLRTRLAELDRERQAILNLLSVWGDDTPLQSEKSAKTDRSRPDSIRGKLVEATIYLIKEKRGPVSNAEILKYAVEQGLNLGIMKDKAQAISIILSQECEKPNTRLKRTGRGIYELK